LSNKIADMDEVDRSILAVLEKDGRISNAELAARVGLSPSPCLRRVRRLEETGVIRGYRALIDPAAAGRGLRVFVAVRLMRHARADVAAFERAVIQLSEVAYSHHVTGNYDYLLQVEVADLPAYEDFHANRLASLPGVAAVNSYVTMKSLSAETACPRP
jgi:Lrp/AsnC family leucine-responsive transcriptional regulator